jgi:hypothetical protein
MAELVDKHQGSQNQDKDEDGEDHEKIYLLTERVANHEDERLQVIKKTGIEHQKQELPS